MRNADGAYAASQLILVCQLLDKFDTKIHQAHLKFPTDYPYNPPSIRFLSKVWHPNVYEVSEYHHFQLMILYIKLGTYHLLHLHHL